MHINFVSINEKKTEAIAKWLKDNEVKMHKAQ